MRKKGYYGALLACLGLLVAGAGASIYSIQKRSTPQPQQVLPNSQQQEQVPSTTVSLQTTPSLEEAMAERETLSQDTAEPPAPETKKSNEPTEEKKATEQQAQPTFSEEADTAQTALFHSDPLFQAPIEGDIVMDYSIDHAIYDVTLEQYRTNDCISISAEKGEKVKSAEDGTVSDVYIDEERGKTIVIQHNNGWTTTYSQLDDDVKVKKGDKVKKGQEIGTVGSPTKYGTLLGTHLDFAVIKDGLYVDPKSAIAE
jgi:murein DD-endopeptidase MepM/ murein hydrolase activator NlpD